MPRSLPRVTVALASVAFASFATDVRGGSTPVEPGVSSKGRPSQRALASIRSTVDRADGGASVLVLLRGLAARDTVGQPISILEHTAVSYAVRSGQIDELGPDARDLADRILATSWLARTGERRLGSALLDRLPRSVLRKATRRERLFHAASFQPDGKQAPSVGRAIDAEQVPTGRDVALVAGAGAAAGMVDGGVTALGLLLAGYGTGASVDYLGHRYVMHEGLRKLQPMFEKMGPFGRKIQSAVKEAQISHLVVHHKRVAGVSYAGALPPEVARSLDDDLAKMGKLGEEIKKTGYGIRQGKDGMKVYLASSLALNAPIAFATSRPLLSLALMMVPSLTTTFALPRVHAALHRTWEDNRATAGPVMRLFLGSRLFDWYARGHYIHHRSGGNYHMLLPGADPVMGTRRRPNMKVAIDLHDQHLPGGYWGEAD